jgi:hypothetical protein
MVVIEGYPGRHAFAKTIIQGSIQHGNKTQVIAEEKIVRVGIGIIDPGYPGRTYSETERNAESFMRPNIRFNIRVEGNGLAQDFRQAEIEIIQGNTGTRIAIAVLPDFLPHQVPGQVNFDSPWIGICDFGNGLRVRNNKPIVTADPDTDGIYELITILTTGMHRLQKD